MKRPYIICHMVSSVDGKVTGDFFKTDKSKIGVAEYYRIHREFKADAFACGRATMEEVLTNGFYPDLTPYADAEIDRTDYIANGAGNDKCYAISFDRYGKLGWQVSHVDNPDPGYGGSHIVQVMCECVPDAYLAYLRDVGVSYIFAGKEEFDIHLALHKLNTLLDIESLLLEGGSTLNSAFYHANLIDELSLVVLPVSGQREDRTLFNTNKIKNFRMKSSTVIKGKSAWVRYERG